jgi:CDP-diacylglycerol--serine O-phosphatidyltransferase
MVFDDTLFYTGASINDIYFHQAERYRLDRYCTIKNALLADSFCYYLTDTFIDSGLAPKLNLTDIPDALQQKKNLALLKQKLKTSHYPVNTLLTHTDLSTGTDNAFITPLVGFGRTKNQLNQATRQLVQGASNNMVIFTPYFNLPHALARDVIRALKRGVKTTMVVGDKTANDFFIADDEDFSTIGIVPYIYEMLLRRFVKRYQNFIDKGLLNIYLWKDGDNSFHLKGLRVDDRYHLITGSNLNPRAWALDLENGLLLDDANQLFLAKTDEELQGILANTTRVRHFSDIEAVEEYPEKPQKLLNKIRVTQIDRVLKRFL